MPTAENQRTNSKEIQSAINEPKYFVPGSIDLLKLKVSLQTYRSVPCTFSHYRYHIRRKYRNSSIWPTTLICISTLSFYSIMVTTSSRFVFSSKTCHYLRVQSSLKFHKKASVGEKTAKRKKSSQRSNDAFTMRKSFSAFGQ